MYNAGGQSYPKVVVTLEDMQRSGEQFSVDVLKLDAGFGAAPNLRHCRCGDQCRRVSSRAPSLRSFRRITRSGMRRERARRIGGVFTRGGNRGLARFRLLHPGPRRRTQGRLACPMVSRAPQRAPTLARPTSFRIPRAAR